MGVRVRRPAENHQQDVKLETVFLSSTTMKSLTRDIVLLTVLGYIESQSSLGLISDAETIRRNIVDDFSCEGRVYGYYADVANECQLFHVCYPVLYPGGGEEMVKWSFICPNQTIFDQAHLVCSFPLDSLPCEDAPLFFEGPNSVNSRFGEKLPASDSFDDEYFY